MPPRLELASVVKDHRHVQQWLNLATSTTALPKAVMTNSETFEDVLATSGPCFAMIAMAAACSGQRRQDKNKPQASNFILPLDQTLEKHARYSSRL